MIVVMKPRCSKDEIKNVCETLTQAGLGTHISQGEEVCVIGVIGDKRKLVTSSIEMMSGVEKIVPIQDTYKLSNKMFNPTPSQIVVDGVVIGGQDVVIMAGPCAVESKEQLLESAHAVKNCGAKFLRGGAYKPRTSPYSFQGLEEEGLKYMLEAKQQTGLRIVTEIISRESIEIAYKYADMFQIGARNMQNFYLLKQVGKTDKPVLLKRGLSSTIDEWLNSAEYIMSEGNHNVVLCERGIRTFETATRNTLDLSAIPVLKSKTHLPVIVDPSHAAGRWEYVESLSLAAVAAGCDGLMVEVHPNPQKAVSDGQQSLNPKKFEEMCRKIYKVREAINVATSKDISMS